MEAKKTQIYNLVILDKSGSMESIRKEAIDGYNETLGSIKSTQLKFMDTQEQADLHRRRFRRVDETSPPPNVLNDSGQHLLKRESVK